MSYTIKLRIQLVTSTRIHVIDILQRFLQFKLNYIQNHNYIINFKTYVKLRIYIVIKLIF